MKGNAVGSTRLDAATSSRRGRVEAERFVLSIAEAAQALGVSDDLVYELTERGELPCLRFGRRKVVPLRAIELVVDAALSGFDPTAVLTVLAGQARIDEFDADASVGP